MPVHDTSHGLPFTWETNFCDSFGAYKCLMDQDIFVLLICMDA